MKLPYALILAAELKVPLVPRKVGALRWGLPTVRVRPGEDIRHLFRGRSPETAIVFIDDIDGSPKAVADPATKR